MRKPSTTTSMQDFCPSVTLTFPEGAVQSVRRKSLSVSISSAMLEVPTTIFRIHRRQPRSAIVEMDSVEGRKGQQVFALHLFQLCSLMRFHPRSQHRQKCYRGLSHALNCYGREVFTTLFPVILTDGKRIYGSSFH